MTGVPRCIVYLKPAAEPALVGDREAVKWKDANAIEWRAGR